MELVSSPAGYPSGMSGLLCRRSSGVIGMIDIRSVCNTLYAEFHPFSKSYSGPLTFWNRLDLDSLSMYLSRILISGTRAAASLCRWTSLLY